MGMFTKLITKPRRKTCADQGWDCCNCGGVGCGCNYCWSCHACDNCLSDDENLDCNLFK